MKSMKTVGEILSVSVRFLSEKGREKPRRSVEEVLAFVLGLKRIDLYMQFDRPLEEVELEVLRSHVKRLSQGEPVDYIIGCVEFYGCKIKVDSRVLIPRPETEIMVDHIVRRLNSPRSIWDICTGSGCIGICLKKRFPLAEVILSDNSKDALEVAGENAKNNQADVSFENGDLFAPFQGKRADAIAINPPYISQAEYFLLDSSVRDYEPISALVGGDRGTEFYERISSQISNYLNPGGKVFLEIGWRQGDQVKEIFSSPLWKKSELIQDWSGKPRFFFLEMQ